MIIDAVADLHGMFPLLKGGDLLIIAGDYTGRDHISQWATFFHWLKLQKYEKKILIAGNHDNLMEKGFPKSQKEADELSELQAFLEEMGEDMQSDFEYLCDSGTEYKGLKIWGSPWSVWFNGVHPKCKAFMITESKLQKKFENIPSDTDILITHTPPYLILDENDEGKPCGSMQLRHQLDTRVFPKLHFFGHIHEQHGKEAILKRPGNGIEKNTHCFNVSYVDENYRPTNQVRRFEFQEGIVWPRKWISKEEAKEMFPS